MDSLVSPGLHPPTVHPIIYERIDACCIKQLYFIHLVLEVPLALMLIVGGGHALHLRDHLMTYAKKLCSVFVDPICLPSFLACHLVSCNKNPGVRSIGICETVRHIIAKSVMSMTRLDILEASGSLQLCAGQIAGVEASIHAVRSCFNEESTEGVLLVDATNAFNSLNRNSSSVL